MQLRAELQQYQQQQQQQQKQQQQQQQQQSEYEPHDSPKTQRPLVECHKQQVDSSAEDRGQEKGVRVDESTQGKQEGKREEEEEEVTVDGDV